MGSKKGKRQPDEIRITAESSVTLKFKATSPFDDTNVVLTSPPQATFGRLKYPKSYDLLKHLFSLEPISRVYLNRKVLEITFLDPDFQSQIGREKLGSLLEKIKATVFPGKKEIWVVGQAILLGQEGTPA